jgi:hypothetical protein
MPAYPVEYFDGKFSDLSHLIGGSLVLLLCSDDSLLAGETNISPTINACALHVWYTGNFSHRTPLSLVAITGTQ